MGRERLYTIDDLENLLDSIPYEIWIKDDDGKHIYVNKLASEKIGLPKDEIIGRTDYEFRSFDMAEKCYSTDEKVIEKKSPLYHEEKFDTGGDDVWYEVHKFPLEKGDTKEVLLGGIAKEVTVNKNLKIGFQKVVHDNHENIIADEEYSFYLKKVIKKIRGILMCRSINLFRYDENLNLFKPYLNSNSEKNIFLDDINLKFDNSIVNNLANNNWDKNFEKLLNKEFEKYYKNEFRYKNNYRITIHPIIFANKLIGIMHIYFDNNYQNYNRSFIDDICQNISSIVSTIEFSREIKEEFYEYISKNYALKMEKESLEKIVELENARVEFLATVSHEFKTPINIILSTVQLLLKNLSLEENMLDREKVINYLKILKQNAYRILRLINNVLDNTQIHNGFYNLDIKNYNIVSVVEDIVLSTVEYIGDNEKEIIFDTDEEEVIIGCDAEKVERIMLNLISNALKFIDNNGKIEVEIKTDLNDHKVFVHVRNNGPSILESDVERIFNKFVQADELLTRRSEGCGIGLFLVRSLVEMHGGEIWLNTDVKEGVEFIFYLPIKIAEEEGIIVNNGDLNNSKIEKCRIEFSDIYSI